MKKYILLLVLTLILFASMVYFFLKPSPLVSVVMPTYNRIGLLPRAIDSILNQTYDNFEFIIVDDGSNDGTKELLKTYAQSDPRIKILTNEKNMGISYSRNRGTDAAKGKYVAIMDSDDYSEATRFEKHVAYLEQHDDVVALNALYYEMGKENNGYNNWVPPARFDFIFHLKNYFTNISFFRTDFVRKHNIRYNEKMMSSEDYDFWAQIFMKGGKLRMLNEQLIRLRRHQSNSKEYYDQIKANARLTSDKLLRHFGVKEPEKLTTDCERMKAMVEVNNQTKKLDSYTITLFYARTCMNYATPENGLYLKHDDFVDYLTPTNEKNVYERVRNKAKYKIIDVKKNNFGDDSIFVIENPDQDIEIYRKQNDGSLGLLFKQELTFIEKLFDSGR